MRSRLAGPASAVVPALVGAAVTLLATSRAWVHASVDDPVVGLVTVSASGRQAAPVVPAVALVALAGAAALLLARALGRRVAGTLLVLAGAAGVAASVSVLRTPESGVAELITKAVGVTGSTPTAVDVSAWPWLAVVGCALVAVGGAVAVLRAGRWSRPRSRYEAPADPTAPEVEPDGPASAEAADPGTTWDALSRGEDPTR
ncbi:MAG TPA: Trp biosynthesis-associated membrane protein [Angustibacter sp.]|nr:Trp biosynthesis-associated membrane protein [Angustibacter sp.]